MTTFVRLPDAQLLPHVLTYRRALAARRRQTIAAMIVLGLAIIAATVMAEVDVFKLVANFTNFTSYLQRIFLFDSGPYTGQLVVLHPGLGTDDWFWGLPKWLKLLGETLLIAYLGTAIGAAFAFIFSFYAADNLGKSRTTRWITKRLLEFCRTVPELVFALIFVVAFGVGALAGVLALAIHTAGALGKLFSEVVENIDMKPADGVIASGGSWTEMVRFGVLPQILSNFTSYGLLRFEINVRGASIMGFVGAGGIGQELLTAIRKFYYADVSAILVLIIVTVMVIDVATEYVRHHLTGAGR